MDIFQMSLSASVLIMAVVIIRALALHKLPKKTFLVLWGVVTIRLLVPFSFPSRFSFYTGIDWARGMLTEKTPSPSVEMPGIFNMPNIPGTEKSIEIGMSSVPISLIEIVWLAGMCACALFFIVTYIKCRREFKMSLPVENDFVTLWLREHPMRRPVQIRQSSKIKAPLTYGVFRPVVLLPKTTDWTDETRLRYILAHEFVHIRRFDTLTKLLLAAAVCVHWFNPLVWVMYALANRDIELACDETVVRTFGATMKSAYALTLIGLEEKKSGLTPLMNHFSKNAIEERIVSIMKMKKTTMFSIVLALALIVGTTAVFATSAAALAAKNTPNLDLSQGTEPLKHEQPFDKNKEQNQQPLPKAVSYGELETLEDTSMSFGVDSFSIVSPDLAPNGYVKSSSSHYIHSGTDMQFSVGWNPMGQKIQIGFISKNDNSQQYWISECVGGNASGTIGTKDIPSGEYYVAIGSLESNIKEVHVIGNFEWK